MIALDTNVLLRYLVQDEPRQSAIASRLIEQELTVDKPGFVSITALLELDWVLRSRYGYAAGNVVAVLRQLLGTATLVFESAEVVEAALASRHGDLADNILHRTALANGCSKTVTFDKRFASAGGVELLT